VYLTVGKQPPYKEDDTGIFEFVMQCEALSQSIQPDKR
jgi:hypothetical protein